MGTLEALLAGVILGFPVALAAFVAARLARSSKPSWRKPAWIPVLPVALVGGNVFVGVVSDPTSHNLWPFEIAIAGFVTLLLFGVFALARYLFGRLAGESRS